jgi:hypothetical protein
VVDVLIDEFRRLDPGLVPFGELPPAWNTEESYRERYIPWLARRVIAAMRRGKYVVALDSAGEFGRHALAHHIWGPRDLDLSAVEGAPPVRNAKHKSAKRDQPADYGARALYHQFADVVRRRGGAAGGAADDLEFQILALTQVDRAPIQEAHRLYRFLEELCKAARGQGKAEAGEDPDGRHERPGGLGESKLCVALTPPAVPYVVQEALEESERLADQFASGPAAVPGDGSPEFVKALSGTIKCINGAKEGAERALDEMIARVNYPVPAETDPRPLACPRVVVFTPERLRSAVRRPDELTRRFDDWQRSEGPDDASEAALLRLASAFRRPRHLLALETVAGRCKRNRGASEPHGSTRGGSRAAQDRDSTDDQTASKQGHGHGVLDVLRGLSDDGAESVRGDEPPYTYFFYQEGGFYQMHAGVRDYIYHQFAIETLGRATRPPHARPHRERAGPTAEEVHAAAAEYYERLFVHSNSLPPLFEAFYHRIAAHRILSLRSLGKPGTPSDTQSADGLPKLLHTLYSLLGRASVALLDGPPAQVLAWLEAVKEEVEVLPEKTDEKEPLLEQLSDLQARVCSAAGNDRGCFDVRRRQLKRLIDPESTMKRLIDPESPEYADLAEVKRWYREHSDDRRAILRMATALRGAGDALAGIESGRDAARSHHRESAEDYLEQALKLARALHEEAAGGPANGNSHAQRAMRLTFGCHLSLADLILGRAERTPRGRGVGELLKRAHKLCEGAGKVLDQYSQRFPDYVARDRAALFIRRARYYLLSAGGDDDGDLHREGLRCLEDARAEAYVGRGEEDHELMAEIRLRTAEDLIERADRLKRAVENDVGASDVEKQVDIIQSLLDRARVQLEQARSALSDGRSNFDQWHLWRELRSGSDRRPGCNLLQLELIKIMLNRAKRLISTLEISRSSDDLTTLDRARNLLSQAHAALSISPPNSEVWDTWKVHHEQWSELDRKWRNLNDHFKRSTQPAGVSES